MTGVLAADRPAGRVSVRRVVVVTRPTDYELLLDRHGSRGQVEFVLRSRGQHIHEVDLRHTRHLDARHRVAAAIPRAWRRANVDRAELDRFLFEPDDLVVAVGQDGLVANLAKYLDGQPVIGIDPEPEVNPGRLVRFAPEMAGAALSAADVGRCPTRALTMVEAELDDGRRLRALNEVFVGHRSHQSARYTIRHDRQQERHSSSGLIVSTGTGATGWASSIHRACRCELDLPAAEEDRLLLLVREPWPSPATGTGLSAAHVTADDPVVVTSAMDHGGTVFGDGIESDPLPFDHGRTVTIRPSEQTLVLAIPGR